MNKEDFLKEIEAYSLDELELISETQRELYSEEEMRLIWNIMDKKKKDVQEQIRAKLPDKLICPKCDGPNPFENDACQFCGCEFDKSMFYSGDYNAESYQENSESHVFQYVISFIIPLVGFILGAILLSKDSSKDKDLGKSFIITGIVSVVIVACLPFIITPW